MQKLCQKKHRRIERPGLTKSLFVGFPAMSHLLYIAFGMPFVMALPFFTNSKTVFHETMAANGILFECRDRDHTQWHHTLNRSAMVRERG